MGDGTGIEWTEATWNPIAGCSVVSPGCEHCYAAREAAGRLSGHPVYAGLAVRPEGGGPAEFTGEVRLLPERLDQPLRWRRPRLIFVNSMSDLFHSEVPYAFVVDVVAVMALASRHTFQVLTKRPKRMARLLANETFRRDVLDRVLAYVIGDGRLPVPDPIAWPLPNVWWGTSIESNKYAWRADALRAMPAAVRWISAEPLLGPLDQLDLTGIDWVVAGGESGPDARPMHPAWVRDLRDRCLALACPVCLGQGEVGVERSHSGGDVAEVAATCVCGGQQPGPAFLFKQWGEWIPEEPADSSRTVKFYLPEVPDGPTSILWRRGKKAAGRLLDGRTWDEYPVARP